MLNKFWLGVITITLALSWHVLSQSPLKQSKEVIKFSHKFHQKEVETACADCHTRAEQSTLASDNLLPAKEECQGCHEVEDEEACTLCHFEDEETRQPLPAVENTLLFNHEFHVLEQKVACETCHKNLDRVDYADDHSKAQMPDCARCHNNQQATLECVNCHTNTLTLRPVDHSSDYLVTHKNLARIDQEACSVCHTRNDCAECHQGASLFMAASAPVLDTQTPMFPSLGGGTKGLLISRVHDLNFRLTHPLEAQGRSQECAVCHETQNFCQTCHEAEGVDVAGKPVWHGGPDWGALAGVVGTGGGRHAELARRDIENCAACHSTEGDDPTCLLCHTDFDGVQGTNPKTHETGFADQIGDDASLHDDDNALCYSCHTNTRQAGAGFCGYCHEAQ